VSRQLDAAATELAYTSGYVAATVLVDPKHELARARDLLSLRDNDLQR
jgi:hypothetical protein